MPAPDAGMVCNPLRIEEVEMRKLMRASVVLAIVLIGFPTACASTRERTDEATRSDVLTRAEIMNTAGARNLHDVVQRLRPRWLITRAEDRSFSMETGIVVYQDQAMLGDVDTLRQLGPSSAYELRYLDGPTATSTLPGIGSGRHIAGAIIIVTRPDR
jgi:hypothetical protein